ncbi:elongation of very long chain fatty acids protein 7-like [Oppia nitens]|uniref:elongation of very long chain fatty acids protein 7-like n=1 Tax=Oppia nitens TaxID=1686743 RepID=UPI0023DB2158|nr:elongation of very long chain fatty acids protein 7-like [Oppia nitens]
MTFNRTQHPILSLHQPYHRYGQPLTGGLSYYLIDFWNDVGDPRTRHLPMMDNGPWTMLSIMASYLVFVRYIGPQLMKDRQAFSLHYLMLFYNILLVLINVYYFAEMLACINYGWDLMDFQFPNKFDVSPKAIRLLYSGYGYFLTKFLDLFDTIFFVLRKKYSQVSTLHLYHHTIVPMLGWLVMRISPTAAPVVLFPICNSVIHAIMYSYYALSTFGPRIQPYLWWKKYLTILQLYQFVLYGLYFTVFLCLQTGYPPIYTSVGYVQPFIFFYMFWQYFKCNYCTNTNQCVV